jgi:N-acetylmuramoyl-L-alanine amidase
MISFFKPKRVVTRVFIHCSASDNPKHDDISVIRDWHVNGNGWADVGYHYFIKKDGQVQIGRNIEQSPAAQVGHNNKTIAICCHGLEESKFTQAQFQSLRLLCASIEAAYAGKITFHGHCEVAAKSCPVFD